MWGAVLEKKITKVEPKNNFVNLSLFLKSFWIGIWVNLLTIRETLPSSVWPKKQKVFDYTEQDGLLKGIYGDQSLAKRILLFFIRQGKLMLPGYFTMPEKILEQFTYGFLKDNDTKDKNPRYTFENNSTVIFGDKSRFHYYDPQVFISNNFETFWSSSGYPLVCMEPSRQKVFLEIWNHKSNIFFGKQTNNNEFQKDDLVMNSLVFDRFLKLILTDANNVRRSVSHQNLDQCSFIFKKYKINRNDVPFTSPKKLTLFLEENRVSVEEMNILNQKKETENKKKTKIFRRELQKSIIESLFDKQKLRKRPKPRQYSRILVWKRIEKKIFVQQPFLLGGMKEKEDEKKKEKNEVKEREVKEREVKKENVEPVEDEKWKSVKRNKNKRKRNYFDGSTKQENIAALAVREKKIRKARKEKKEEEKKKKKKKTKNQKIKIQRMKIYFLGSIF